MCTTSAIDNSTCATAAVAYDDLALVHACKQGDVAAFEQLVKRHTARVFSIAQHVTHNREDAEDVVQDAFLKAFRNLNQFRENSQFSTWLVRIVVNESLMRLRKQRRYVKVSIDDNFQNEEGSIAFELQDWAPNPEEQYRASELRDILRNELQELPETLKVIFVLRDVEGFSTEQAAGILDLTPAAAKARLWRARLTLRPVLPNISRPRRRGTVLFC